MAPDAATSFRTVAEDTSGSRGTLHVAAPRSAGLHHAGSSAGTVIDRAASAEAALDGAGSSAGTPIDTASSRARPDLASSFCPTFADVTSPVWACTDTTSNLVALALQLAAPSTGIDIAVPSCPTAIDAASPSGARTNAASVLLTAAPHRTGTIAAGNRAVGSVTGNRARPCFGAIHGAGGPGITDRFAGAMHRIRAYDIAGRVGGAFRLAPAPRTTCCAWLRLGATGEVAAALAFRVRDAFTTGAAA